jgi:hypothetical protein
MLSNAECVVATHSELEPDHLASKQVFNGAYIQNFDTIIDKIFRFIEVNRQFNLASIVLDRVIIEISSRINVSCFCVALMTLYVGKLLE